MATLAEQALAYSTSGFRVFPIWPIRQDRSCACPKGANCDSVGKHPLSRLVPQGVKNATDDEQIVAGWWRQFPTANIGLATGDNFFVIDIDRHGAVDGFQSVALLSQAIGVDLNDIECPKVMTGGGGEHWFFPKDPEIDVRNQQGLKGGGGRFAGIDVRGDGGYVVAAPSSHASGTPYAWFDGHDLDSMTATPPGLLQLVCGQEAKAMPLPDPGPQPQATFDQPCAVPLNAMPQPPSSTVPAQTVEWIKTALALIPPNEGREAWVEMVSMPLHDEFDGHDEGFQIWHAWCQTGIGHSTPTGNAAYGGEAECRKIWRSFSRGKRNPKGIATFWAHARRYGWERPSSGQPIPSSKSSSEPGIPPAPLLKMPLPKDDHEIKPWPDLPESLYGPEDDCLLDVSAAFPDELWWLRDLVLEIGRLHQTPAAFPALLSIGMAAGCAGKLFEVRFDDMGWSEPMALWVMCAMPSGAGKSPIIKPLRAPIDQFERANNGEYINRVSDWDTDKKIAAGRAVVAERDAQRADDAAMVVAISKLKGEQRKLAKIMAERPQSRGVIASSLTTPALVDYLKTHGGRCLIVDSEGGVFGHVLGGTNAMEKQVDPWLQAFSGDTIDQRRVGDSRSGPIERIVYEPALSMALVTQVDRMDLFSDSYADSKGFLARFIPAIFNHSMPTIARIKGEIPTELLARWRDRVIGLLEAPIPEKPARILVSGEAKDLIDDWMQRWLDEARKDEDLDRESMTGYTSPFGAKARSIALRLVGLLHLLIDPATAEERPIDPATVRCVTDSWLPFIAAQVERVARVTREDPNIRIAARVLRWLQRRGGDESFTRSDARNNLKAKNANSAQVQSVDDLNFALAHLTDAGWIQPAEKPVYRFKSVPSARRYLVHPRLVELMK